MRRSALTDDFLSVLSCFGRFKIRWGALVEISEGSVAFLLGFGMAR